MGRATEAGNVTYKPGHPDYVAPEVEEGEKPSDGKGSSRSSAPTKPSEPQKQRSRR